VTPQLAALLDVFGRWLYLPEPGPLLVSLATVAGNRIDGKPNWVQLIGPPGSGKTEIIQSLDAEPDTYPAGDMTVAGLLSGSPSRDRDYTSTGGLLIEIGDFGIILVKDFTTVLSMHRGQRQAVLGLLREVYDGSVVRILGTDGGKTFEWHGKVGFLAACTGTIDRHHSVMATMGERFLLYRMPAIDEDEQADRALDHAGSGEEMRVELSGAVGKFFQEVELRKKVNPAEGEERVRLRALASLVARSRSAVERDGRSREVELILDPETPNRIIIALDRLRAGLLAIGLEPAEAWPLVEKVGLDCLPAVRSHLVALLRQEESLTPGKVSIESGYPPTTTERHLEDLQAHGVVSRVSGKWGLTDWAKSKLAILEGHPEKSADRGDAPDLSVPAPSPEKSHGVSPSPDMSDDPPGSPEKSPDIEDRDDISGGEPWVVAQRLTAGSLKGVQ
jgi:hypothetical protein